MDTNALRLIADDLDATAEHLVEADRALAQLEIESIAVDALLVEAMQTLKRIQTLTLFSGIPSLYDTISRLEVAAKSLGYLSNEPPQTR